jgi:hypothetical protein
MGQIGKEQKDKGFIIDHLHSGGVITNYYCTSSCGHCLYACSPLREKEYIRKDTLTRNLQVIKNLGCRSIHLGGGEPFLNMDGLKMVIETVNASGVKIEYVETNSSWYRDKDSACGILSSLKKRGLSTVLISMSPFHNEYIPFYKVKGVVEACSAVGMNVFPWIAEFYSEITSMGDESPHNLSEYEKTYGIDYLKKLPSRYWIHFGGRALKTFAPIIGKKPYKEFVTTGNYGCSEILDVSHFHFDLFGNYIPGLCSGLTIRWDDLGKALSTQKYPILNILFMEGVRGLFHHVSKEYGFEPAGGYMSKCHLCFDLRRHLILEEKVDSFELQPKSFYDQV